MSAPAVVLCSDFGLVDTYVGEMKAALLQQWSRWPAHLPRPAIVDLSHGIPAGDIAAGALVLRRGAPRFPPATVFVAVVDPGVGTSRPAVAVRAGGRTYVGPGNGLFAHLAAEADLDVRLVDRAPAADGAPRSSTFHGRDLFAPTAAHLAMGRPLATVGEAGTVDDLGRCAEPPPAAGALGRIVWIDRFGNAVSDIAYPPRRGTLALGGRGIDGPYDTYGSAPPGEPFWYLGSGATVEFALRDGNGAEKYGWQVGMAVGPAAT